MKVMVKMSETQANIIQEALDLYSRLGIGQVEELHNFFGFRLNRSADYDIGHKYLKQLKQIYFPELAYNSSLGIFNKNTPEQSKIAWDIIQVLRHDVSWFKQPKGGLGVNFDTPLKSSEKEELIKVEIK